MFGSTVRVESWTCDTCRLCQPFIVKRRYKKLLDCCCQHRTRRAVGPSTKLCLAKTPCICHPAIPRGRLSLLYKPRSAAAFDNQPTRPAAYSQNPILVATSVSDSCCINYAQCMHQRHHPHPQCPVIHPTVKTLLPHAPSVPELPAPRLDYSFRCGNRSATPQPREERFPRLQFVPLYLVSLFQLSHLPL